MGKTGYSKEELNARYYQGFSDGVKNIEAKYEDLGEQGLLLRLPCKVGDTVYVPHRGKIQEMIIQMVSWNGTGFFFSWTLNSGIYPWLDGFGDMNIGKTVFLTQAEAEQKLKEIESD